MGLLNFRNPGWVWQVYGRSVFRYATPRKIANALRTEYACRRRIADVKPALYQLFLEPLNYWIRPCPFCDRQIFPDSRRNSAGKMTLGLYDQILDQVGDYLFQCHIFGQGEPMLDWPLTRQFIENTQSADLYTR